MQSSQSTPICSLHHKLQPYKALYVAAVVLKVMSIDDDCLRLCWFSPGVGYCFVGGCGGYGGCDESRSDSDEGHPSVYFEESYFSTRVEPSGCSGYVKHSPSRIWRCHAATSWHMLR